MPFTSRNNPQFAAVKHFEEPDCTQSLFFSLDLYHLLDAMSRHEVVEYYELDGGYTRYLTKYTIELSKFCRVQ